MVSRSVRARPHLRLVAPIAAPARASAVSRIRATNRNIGLLLIPTALLVAIGLIMVFSSSYVQAELEYGSSFLFFQRQAMYAVVGIAALLVTSRMRYSAWQRLAFPLLAGTCLLLLMVLHPSAGTVAGGSARWLELGPVTVQPSEPAKLALVVFASLVLTRKSDHLDEVMHVVLPLLPVVAVVCTLVMLQPDLGTTLVLAGAVFVMLFLGGVRFRHLAAAAVIGVLVGSVLIMGESYRRARFLSFLHPYADPQNTGYHLIQSLIALGSGGWFGVGLGASRQKWMYVPNAHTDFIFSILGEELGLIAAIVVLALFGIMIYAGVRIAARAPDHFGQLLAGGIVGWLGLQTIVNLGAVTGLLPITGVPLPLLSYGGSSLVVTLASIGILVNVARCSARSTASGGGRGRSAPRETGRKAVAG